MIRQLQAARTAFLFAGLMLAPTPAFAAPAYQAQPAAQPSEARIVLRDTIWKCGEAGCTGSKSNSRPAIVCAVLAREIGTLASFSVKGEALSAEELGKCNSRARAGAAVPVQAASAQR